MKDRVYYFDNLKVILIFLVVLGHFTNIDRSNPFIGGLNNMIYAFHMPVFIFVSGYFSRNITRQRLAEIDRILYPFLLFQVIYFIFIRTTGLGNMGDSLFTPIHQNWYLLGIFFWRLLIPYVNFYPKKVVLFFSLLVSFSIGFIPEFNDFLGLYRILYFFPFFILGYYGENLLAYKTALVKHKNIFIGLFGIALLIIFAASVWNPQIKGVLSLAYTPFKGYGDNHFILLYRLFGFLSAACVGFLFLYLIPEKKLSFTKFGPYTINVFLLHMLLVWPLHHFCKSLNTGALLTIFITSSLAITYIISQEWVNRLLQPFINFEKVKLFFTGNKDA